MNYTCIQMFAEFCCATYSKSFQHQPHLTHKPLQVDINHYSILVMDLDQITNWPSSSSSSVKETQPNIFKSVHNSQMSCPIQSFVCNVNHQQMTARWRCFSLRRLTWLDRAWVPPLKCKHTHVYYRSTQKLKSCETMHHDCECCFVLYVCLLVYKHCVHKLAIIKS